MTTTNWSSHENDERDSDVPWHGVAAAVGVWATAAVVVGVGVWAAVVVAVGVGVGVVAGVVVGVGVGVVAGVVVAVGVWATAAVVVGVGIGTGGEGLLAMKRRTETDLVRECLDVLHKFGVLAWRNNTGAVVAECRGRKRFVRFGMPGMADIFGVLRGGRFIAIECKSKRGRVSAEQEAFMQMIRRHGGIAWLVREGNAPIELLVDALMAEYERMDSIKGSTT